MNIYLAIAIGGACGAMGRYWLSNLVAQHNTGPFPGGTLLVNILGSLLIGMLFVILLEKSQGAAWLRPLLMVGFLGAFTTFSAFSLEVLVLMEQGLYGSALTYVLASVASCILAAWIGIGLTRLLI